MRVYVRVCGGRFSRPDERIGVCVCVWASERRLRARAHRRGICVVRPLSDAAVARPRTNARTHARAHVVGMRNGYARVITNFDSARAARQAFGGGRRADRWFVTKSAARYCSSASAHIYTLICDARTAPERFDVWRPRLRANTHTPTHTHTRTYIINATLRYASLCVAMGNPAAACDPNAYAPRTHLW